MIRFLLSELAAMIVYGSAGAVIFGVFYLWWMT